MLWVARLKLHIFVLKLFWYWVVFFTSNFCFFIKQRRRSHTYSVWLCHRSIVWGCFLKRSILGGRLAVDLIKIGQWRIFFCESHKLYHIIQKICSVGGDPGLDGVTSVHNWNITFYKISIKPSWSCYAYSTCNNIFTSAFLSSLKHNSLCWWPSTDIHIQLLLYKIFIQLQ